MITREAINNAIRILLLSGKEVPKGSWQGVDSPSPMYEVENLFIQMEMCSDQDELARQTKADLPWAEDHFQERIGRDPTNPGHTYRNWPYYNGIPNDELFRKEGVFSHTYQERFWPTSLDGSDGIRYPYGDFDDVTQMFREDPNTRQAFLSIWHPEDQSLGSRRRPCTIGYWFKQSGSRLNLTYLIRSCDAARHFRNDVYMAQRLADHFLWKVSEKTTVKKLGILSMWIGSFHRFDQDEFELKKRLNA